MIPIIGAPLAHIFVSMSAGTKNKVWKKRWIWLAGFATVFAVAKRFAIFKLILKAMHNLCLQVVFYE